MCRLPKWVQNSSLHFKLPRKKTIIFLTDNIDSSFNIMMIGMYGGHAIEWRDMKAMDGVVCIVSVQPPCHDDRIFSVSLHQTLQPTLTTRLILNRMASQPMCVRMSVACRIRTIDGIKCWYYSTSPPPRLNDMFGIFMYFTINNINDFLFALLLSLEPNYDVFAIREWICVFIKVLVYVVICVCT